MHPVQQVQYSLRSLLSWLEVPDVNKLHNAGNDARWANSLGRDQGVGQGRLWTAGGSVQRAGSRALQGILWQAEQRWHGRAGALAHLTSPHVKATPLYAVMRHGSHVLQVHA